MFLGKETTRAKVGKIFWAQRNERGLWLVLHPRETRLAGDRELEVGGGREGSQVGSRLSPEPPEPARASPDPLAFSALGAGVGVLAGAPLSAVLAELSRELLLELGAVVSRCCCSAPWAPRASSAGR